MGSSVSGTETGSGAGAVACSGTRGADTGATGSDAGAGAFSVRSIGIKPGGAASPGGAVAGTGAVLSDSGTFVEESEIGFFFGEPGALGGFVLCVESDDLPLTIEIAFFFSVRAAPIGKIEGEGEGNGKAVLLATGVDLSETRFPILSGFVPLAALLAGIVLTEMFLPQPAELGSAEAIVRSAHGERDLHPRSSAAGFGQCDLIVKDGGATAACFCRASYSAGLVNLESDQSYAPSPSDRLGLTQSRNHPLRNSHYPLPIRADIGSQMYHISSLSRTHRSTVSFRTMP
jgi:hypothetical protein